MIPLDGTRWQVQQGCVTRTKRNRLLLPQSQSRYWLTTVIFTTSRIYYHLFTPSNNPFLSSLAKHCECNVHCSFIYTLSQLAISSRAAQGPHGQLTLSSRSTHGQVTVTLTWRSVQVRVDILRTNNWNKINAITATFLLGTFSNAFSKLRKATISFVMFVCPSVFLSA